MTLCPFHYSHCASWEDRTRQCGYMDKDMKLEVEDHEMGRPCLSHLVALDPSFLLNLICLMYKIEINIYTELG